MTYKNVFHLCLLTLAPFFVTVAYAQVTVIHDFTGQGGDGADPESGVTLKGDALYGTTILGGIGLGSVYQMTKLGSNWTYTPVLLFPGGPGGGHPRAGITFGPDGHAYGTTGYTDSQYGFGDIFKLTPPLSICKTAYCSWTENVIYNFQDDGPYEADLVFDQNGNAYGTAYGGAGAVYQMTKSGDMWLRKIIYKFTGGADGKYPMSGVITDNNGNLFGTTSDGGLYGYGTVFKLAYVNGNWVESVLYAFQDGEDGGHPKVGLVRDASGNLYGSTDEHHGSENQAGTIFDLSPTGDTYDFHTIYTPPGIDRFGGTYPLTIDASGDIYGISEWDGENGSVFRLHKSGLSWQYQVLYQLLSGEGECPCSKVTIGLDNNLYGTAVNGGRQNHGVVWMAPNYH